MWCMKCNHDLSECTCPDLMERLKSVSSTAPFAFQRCKKCGLHHGKCKCEHPDLELVGGEKPAAATVKDLSKDESEKKLLSLIMDMKGLCVECMEDIPEETQRQLNDAMGGLFESQCDEEHNINLIHMVFMLANGLSFILAQLMNDGATCDECKAKAKASEFSKMVH